MQLTHYLLIKCTDLQLRPTQKYYADIHNQKFATKSLSAKAIYCIDVEQSVYKNLVLATSLQAS